ncbi:MAG: hypothetical protein DHS20C11_01300 [Lysobacteraceae bacterium]|nr:MAG: hypothetical protein DHS20C11_01300 [Xanthomonadaceae bacterium]
MSGPRRAWRRFAVIATGLVLAALLGVALLASFAVPVGLGLFKNQIANASTQLLGLPITFDQAVLRTGPQPRLSATGLVLGSVDKPLLRVQQLEAGLELAALFSSQVELTAIEISGLVYDAHATQLQLSSDDNDDSSDWQVVAPPELMVTDAAVLGENFHVDTLQLVTDQQSRISVQAMWQDLPMTLDAQLPPLQALHALRWDQALLELKVLDSEVRAQASEMSESGGVLQVSGDIDSTAWQLLGLAGGPQTLNLQSRVQRDQQTFLLSELSLSADSDRLQIERLEIESGGDRLAVKGQINDLAISIDSWQRWLSTEAADEPSALQQWPLDLQLEIDQVSANYQAHDVVLSSSKLSMNHSVLRLVSALDVASDAQSLGHAQIDASVLLQPDCMRLSGSSQAALQRPWQLNSDFAVNQLQQVLAEFDICIDDIDSALANPKLKLDVSGLAIAMDESAMPVDQLSIELGDGRGVANIRTVLEGRPLTATIRAPGLPQAFESGQMPFELDVDDTEVASALSGTISWNQDDFSVLADLTAAGRGDGELKLSAAVQLDNEQLSIQDVSVDMVGIDLEGQFKAEFSDPPRMTVEANAGLIDKARLMHYLGRLDRELEEAEQQGDAFDWLGADFEFIDQLLATPLIEFRLAIEEIAGLAVGVSDIKAQGKLGAGRIDDAQISANFDNVDVAGTLKADFSGHEEQLALTLDAQNVDLDAILRRLKINPGVEIQAPSASLSVQSKGRNLAALLTHADLRFAIPQTSFDIGGGDELWRTLSITEMVVGTGVGDPVRIDALVDIDGAPMTAELIAPSIDDMLNKPEEPIAVQLTLGSEEDQLTAVGRVLQPVSDDRFEADIQLSGTRLDLLDGADDDLQPELGPYSIAANIKATPERVELSLTEATIGYSRLQGAVTIDRSQSRQRIDVVVDAERIRIEDLVDTELADAVDPAEQDQVPATVAEQLDRFFNEFLPELVLESDLSLTLQADEIRANEQLLGSGVVVATLMDKRLHVSRLEIITPHGEIMGSLDLADTAAGASIDLDLDIDGLDMAVVAQRVGQDHDGLGLLFMKADLHGEGQDIVDMRRSLTGRLDMFFWPENVSAGTYDLWVSNVFLAILPLFGKGESNFNCAVARFGIADGVMNAETLMVDTSKMVVHGRGEINLADQTLLLGFVPQSKKAAFLSMETPVTIKGPIDDFGVSIGPLDMAFSAFRLYYNLLYVPYQWMRGRALPEDGMPICLQEMQWEQPEDRPAALQDFPIPFEDQKKPRRSR